MDDKEKIICLHYKKLIEDENFDEYDILGFLIFSRNIIRARKLKNLLEFADLIAHRNRNKGKVMEAIKIANLNAYELIEGTNQLKGYLGIPGSVLEKEIISLLKVLDIEIRSCRVIHDFILCIFSLTQFSVYENEQISGRVILFQSRNKLALITVEDDIKAPYACFSILDKCEFSHIYSGGYINSPVEAIRVEGKLRLKNRDGYII
ncbi:MAG: hypothetical protein IK014_00635 [Lachnospiraceae bacterium]|nr:hypothetical protein [Lachnospiraceae bacterium]